MSAHVVVVTSIVNFDLPPVPALVLSIEEVSDMRGWQHYAALILCISLGLLLRAFLLFVRMHIKCYILGIRMTSLVQQFGMLIRCHLKWALSLNMCIFCLHQPYSIGTSIPGMQVMSIL